MTSMPVRATIPLMLLLSFGALPIVADEADAFFDDSYVHEIRIYFDDPNWYSTLYTSHASDTDDPYFPGRFEGDGIVLDPVGIRFKGNSSFMINSTKKSFKIDFDEYDEDNPNLKFLGLKKLNLNNGFKDPTLMRAKLFLDFAGQHVPAVRAVHTRVYVNDVYWGLYTAVEQVDKTFAQNRFGNSEDGNLWKAQAEEDGAPDDDFGSDMTYLGTEPEPYYDYYNLKTNEEANDYSQLIEFIDVLNNTPTAALPDAIDPLHDVFTSLKGLALNNLFVNLDSYTGSAHNYYIYDRDDTDRITHVHWDANEAFGRFLLFVATGDNPLQLDPFWTPVAGPGQDDQPRPLMENLWEVAAYNQYYLDFMALTLENGFDLVTMSSRIQELANLIRADVYADTKKMYSDSQFETNLTSNIYESGPGGGTIYGLEHFVQARAAYLETVLPALDPTETLYINEIMADNETTVFDEQGDFDDWVEIYNPGAADIDLAGYWFTDAEMPLWQIPGGSPAQTTVPAGGYVLVWFDREPSEGPLHVDARLNEASETVILYAPDAVQVIDSHEFGHQYDDVPTIRYPDTADDWYLTLTPTPLAPNSYTEVIPGCTDPDALNYDPNANVDEDFCEYPPSEIEVFINEFIASYDTLSGPAGVSDWLELYNASEDAVDLSDWTITDTPGDDSETYTFPAGTTLEAGGFMVVICDNASYFDGTFHHVPFKLGGDDELLLKHSNGSEVDYIVYDKGQGTDQGMSFDYPEENGDAAWGRTVDGGPDWGEIKPQTPGEPNISLVVRDVAAVGYNTVVDVSWSCDAPDLSGFKVYSGSSADGPFGLVTIDPVERSPYRHKPLFNGMTRYYYVVPLDAAGQEGFASTVVSATPELANGTTPVTDLLLETTGDDLVLRWTQVTSSPSVASYRIFRDDSPLADVDVDAGLHLLSEVSGVTEFVDAGEAATPEGWYYEVRVVDSAGAQSDD